MEGGAPKGRRLAPQRYERECEIARFPVSSSRAESRDLFRLRVSSFLCESVCMKHRSVQFIWSMAFPVIRYPRILGLIANGKDFSLSLEMTIWGKKAVFLFETRILSRFPRILSGSLCSPPSPRGEGYGSGDSALVNKNWTRN